MGKNKLLNIGDLVIDSENSLDSYGTYINLYLSNIATLQGQRMAKTVLEDNLKLDSTNVVWNPNQQWTIGYYFKEESIVFVAVELQWQGNAYGNIGITNGEKNHDLAHLTYQIT